MNQCRISGTQVYVGVRPHDPQSRSCTFKTPPCIKTSIVCTTFLYIRIKKFGLPFNLRLTSKISTPLFSRSEKVRSLTLLDPRVWTRTTKKKIPYKQKTSKKRSKKGSSFLVRSIQKVFCVVKFVIKFSYFDKHFPFTLKLMICSFLNVFVNKKDLLHIKF